MKSQYLLAFNKRFHEEEDGNEEEERDHWKMRGKYLLVKDAVKD